MRIPPTLAIAVILALAIGMPSCSRAAVSNVEVTGAIDRAKAFLWSKQKDGHWETQPMAAELKDPDLMATHQWGGATALVTYALLAAGERPQDPRLAAAVDFLKAADVRGTYALALRMQVWLLLPPTRETAALMRKDAALLLATTQARGNARGLHGYRAGHPMYSHSCSQFAVLGAWAAEQLVPDAIPPRYWQLAEAAWLDHQDRAGGWAYRALMDTPGEGASRGMTAAGVATLFILQDCLHAQDAAGCRGNAGNRAIDAGVAWLADSLGQAEPDDRAVMYSYMTWYAVERVGVAGGLTHVGGHDWYAEGADWILRQQAPDGSFEMPKGVFSERDGPLIQTPFAILFLARGRAPVAVGKVDYSVPKKAAPPWNQRPRDVANLVRWLGRSLERDLNWQVVNLDAAPEELLRTQVLYLAGNQALALTEQQSARFKAYVEMGGLVVGHADCANLAFAASFRRLGQKLFPAAEFRELPPTHVIYNGQFGYAGWKTKPQVQGLSNGARELMLLVHGGDPARQWQTRAVSGHEEAWQLMANVFHYQNDQRDLRYRGDTHWVTPNGTPADRRLAVARVRYAGNWDPEPGGWRRLAAIVNNGNGLALQVDPVTPGEGRLAGYTVAHLTGTATFALPDAAVAELRTFVQDGGCSWSTRPAGRRRSQTRPTAS